MNSLGPSTVIVGVQTVEGQFLVPDVEDEASSVGGRCASSSSTSVSSFTTAGVGKPDSCDATTGIDDDLRISV